eukprot:TRINITY_DN25630_c0_g1_i1.p1 TRINITY_DN25630_c0_g1~~TRINITY_DN25630_c0_g1_i1.p1  ORF type:complete len:147 (-),score=42.90 TRINITY_DN25630_c0_g1_i1:326-766(-)
MAEEWDWEEGPPTRYIVAYFITCISLFVSLPLITFYLGPFFLGASTASVLEICFVPGALYLFHRAPALSRGQSVACVAGAVLLSFFSSLCTLWIFVLLEHAAASAAFYGLIQFLSLLVMGGLLWLLASPAASLRPRRVHRPRPAPY